MTINPTLLYAGAAILLAVIVLALWARSRKASPTIEADPALDEEMSDRVARMAARRRDNETTGTDPDEVVAEPAFFQPEELAAVTPMLQEEPDAPPPETGADPVSPALDESEPPGAPEAQARPVSVRLVPQIPMRSRGAPRNWVGGWPRLPDELGWPEIDGRPCTFLAQIELADMPEDLWNGLGPREGMLAFFVHPTECDVHVLHLSGDGKHRQPPEPLPIRHGWLSPLGADRSDETMECIIPLLPEWPVDPVVLRPGERPVDGAEPDPGARLYLEGYDLADPRFHPPSWESLLAFMAMAEAELAQRAQDPADALFAHEQALSRHIEEIETAERNGAPQSEVEAQRNAAQALAEWIGKTKRAHKRNAAALEQLRALRGIVGEHAATAEYSAQEVAGVMEQLQQITAMTVSRTADPQGAANAEIVTTHKVPLTVHHPDAPLVAHAYLPVLFDHMKHAYAADAALLSQTARDFWEPFWRDMAALALPRLGGWSEGEDKFSGDHESELLLAIPKNPLFGVGAADGGALAIVLSADALATGQFTEAVARIAP